MIDTLVDKRLVPVPFLDFRISTYYSLTPPASCVSALDLAIDVTEY